MKSDIDYKVRIEPVLHAVFNKLIADCDQIGFTEDDIVHAMWVFADNKVDESSPRPQWLWTELGRKSQLAEDSNTVDGEVGG